VRGAHDSVKPGVESRFIGAELQVPGQLRTMSPRQRAAAFAIAERLNQIRCRPFCGLGSLFVTCPGAHAPGLYAVVRSAHCWSVKYVITFARARISFCVIGQLSVVRETRTPDLFVQVLSV